MMKRIASAAALLLIMFSAVPAHAAVRPVDPQPGGGGLNNGNNAGNNTGCGGNGVAGFLGFKSWDACLDHDANGVPQFNAIEDVWKVGIVVVEFVIKLSGYLAVGFIIWGAIKYLKSQGDPSELTQARQIINNALMGLIICLLSVAIVQFIAERF